MKKTPWDAFKHDKECSQLPLENQHDNVYNQQTCLSVAQLLVFNTYKRHRKLGTQNFTKHSRKREPSLPVLIGLLIHSQNPAVKPSQRFA